MHDNYRRHGCSGYNRIGTSVCRNYYLLADEMESLALDAIRTQIKSPKWSAEVKRTLEGMVGGEFQNPLAHEIEERRKQLQEVTRQIENVVQAIQKNGFSEALELSLRSLESQRDGLRHNLKEIEAKVRLMAGADRAQDRVYGLVGEFDAMWERASMDEKKMLVKDFLYGVTVDPDGQDIKATYHVWTIPGIGKEISATLQAESAGRVALAPVPYLAGHPDKLLSLKSVAGAGLEPATYAL